MIEPVTNIRPDAIKVLERDEILRPLLQQCKPLVVPGNGEVASYLIRSVISQQLSTAAAATIYLRWRDAIGSAESELTILPGLSDEVFRACGISASKARYMREIARHFDDRNLHTVNWHHLPDEDIVYLLLPIPGVGRWTVEMVLMFCLNREDVLPIDDLVIRQQMVSLYQVSGTPANVRTTLLHIGEAWRPYRSLACRYLWVWNDEQRKQR